MCCLRRARSKKTLSYMHAVDACRPKCCARRLYAGCPTPAQLSCVARVGPLRRSDVPLSAIDFHVSDIVPHLLASPEVRRLAAG